MLDAPLRLEGSTPLVTVLVRRFRGRVVSLYSGVRTLHSQLLYPGGTVEVSDSLVRISAPLTFALVEYTHLSKLASGQRVRCALIWFLPFTVRGHGNSAQTSRLGGIGRT